MTPTLFVGPGAQPGFALAPGLSTPSGPCQAGYFCARAAVSPAPEDGLTGGPCPPGTFCRECVLGPPSQPPGPPVLGWEQTRFLVCVWTLGRLGGGRRERRGLRGPHEAELQRPWPKALGCLCGVSRGVWPAVGRWPWPCHTAHWLALGGMSPGDAPPAAGEGLGSPSAVKRQGGGPQGGGAEAGPTGGATRAVPSAGAGFPTCGLPVPSASASHRPTPCPPGTFSSLPEQTALSVCQACPRGFYCKEAGLQVPTGRCPAGERPS